VLHTALAVGAGLVATAFALSTFERWLARHRRHDASWTVALACFAVAAFALAFGAAHGWGAVSFRVFYLFGAIVNVPVLALGTVYLLGGQRRGDVAAAAVALVCAFATGVVVAAPLKAAIPVDRLPQGSEVFGALPRILAALCSAVPALVIFGGAVWSAARYRTSRQSSAEGARPRLWSNVLIALGTLTLSSSGVFNSVLGEMDAFAVALTIGIVILFAGFLVAASTNAGPTNAGPTNEGRVEAPSHRDRAEARPRT
jgi:hypothetical protein